MIVTIEEMIRQKLMIGFSGPTLSGSERNLIREISTGGVILFSRNVKEPEQIRGLCKELQGLAGNIPMFIAIDEEGGRVRRFCSPFTPFPPMREIGKRKSMDLARRFAIASARELSAVGVNVNFAPVLDVDSNPENPIIGDRSFGSEPETVSRMSVPIIEGFQSEGVLAVGKHFPGHGDTSEDSHLTLPSVKKTREELENCEFIPFRNAIDNGVKALMSAHVYYPNLDENNNATLSEKILKQILRKEMGFDGIIFSDDFEMKALDQSALGEAAVAGTKSGVDIFIVCHSAEKQKTVFNAILDAVKSGEIDTKTIEESYQRIIRVKKEVFANKGNKKPISWVGHPEHSSIVKEIAGKTA